MPNTLTELTERLRNVNSQEIRDRLSELADESKSLKVILRSKLAHERAARRKQAPEPAGAR